MQIGVVSLGRGRARMYWEGKRMGDDLTDNSAIGDGYRFHDVMHLANIAKLGWSPVFRKLMDRKRKSDPNIDEIQDGARAGIVEEALIKAVHSEGLRQAKQRTPNCGPEQLRPFLNDSEISNRFLEFIKSLVAGLEVKTNHSWEWIKTIVEGYDIFHQIREEKQGTITLDLEARSITFRPEVGVNINGSVSGLGSAILPLTQKAVDRQKGLSFPQSAWETVTKLAIANALDVEAASVLLNHFTVKELGEGIVSVKSEGSFQELLWYRRIVSFKTKTTEDEERLYCTAVAISADVT